MKARAAEFSKGFSKTCKRISQLLGPLWKPLRMRLRRAERRLRLRETLALGDKRFLAIVDCDHQRFLIGGAANSVSLLTALPKPLGFGEILARIQPAGKVR